jgi:hypothetical protein
MNPCPVSVLKEALKDVVEGRGALTGRLLKEVAIDKDADRGCGVEERRTCKERGV